MRTNSQKSPPHSATPQSGHKAFPKLFMNVTDVNKIAELFPSAYITENAIILFFDKEWNVLEETHSDASYEAILVTEKADASSVYSDIKDYGSSYSGKAAKGNVAVLNIKDTDEVISSIPKDQDIVIISYTVDTPLSQKESK